MSGVIVKPGAVVSWTAPDNDPIQGMTAVCKEWLRWVTENVPQDSWEEYGIKGGDKNGDNCGS